jgi:hypothetical protein
MLKPILGYIGPNWRMLIFFRGLAHHRQYLDPGHGSDRVWPCLGSSQATTLWMFGIALKDQNSHLTFVETVDNKRRIFHILVSRKSLSTGSRDSQLFFLRCSGCRVWPHLLLAIIGAANESVESNVTKSAPATWIMQASCLVVDTIMVRD